MSRSVSIGRPRVTTVSGRDSGETEYPCLLTHMPKQGAAQARTPVLLRGALISVLSCVRFRLISRCYPHAIA